MCASILTQTLEREKNDIISQIVSIVEETTQTRNNEIKGSGGQDVLRERITGLINDMIHMESATKVCDITILLSDLRGFTAMSENYSPSSVIEMLNRYFSKMSEIIVTDHGGIIDKFMGDSIMALFSGAESPQEDLAKALSCAVNMQIAMDDVNIQNESLGMPPLYMGIGINTGSVVTGKVGSDIHSEFTAIGDQVNLASRIEAYSLRGQVLISENSYRLAEDFIETSDPIQALVKGKAQPVNLYELISIKRPIPLTVPRREVRKSPRIDVDLPFIFQRVADKKVLPEKYNGQILDISYHGLLSIIPEPLEALSEIKFTLSSSIFGGQTNDIYAKIINVKDHEGKYQASVEFTSIHVQAKEAIKLFIDRIIQGI